MRTAPRFLLLLLITLLTKPAINSQVRLWQQTQGPYGGAVSSFCLDGIWTYAGGSGGVFMSTDGGDHWAHIGPTNINVTKIVTGGGYIFVGTDRQGLFRSGDRGKTWLSLGHLLPAYFYPIADMAIKDSIVFVTNYGEWYGVYRSSDWGNTWSSADVGIDNRDIRKIIATDSSLISSAAGGEGSGMFRSIDDGISWARVDPNQYAWNAECLSRYQGVIYGADYENSARILNSTDDGRTWGRAIGGPDDIIVSLFVNRLGIFAGSSDGFFILGQNLPWVNAGGSLFNKYILTLDGTDSVVYASSADGIYRSSDGKTWLPKNEGMTNSAVSCLTSISQTVFAGTAGAGLFRTDDQAMHWSRVDLGTSNAQFIRDALTVSDHIYVIAGGNPYPGSGRVLVSINNGLGWMSASGNAIDDATSLCASGNTIYVATGSSGTYSSPDNGNSWLNSPSPSARSIAALGPVLITAGSYGAINRSTDRGITWTLVIDGLSGSPPITKVAAISGLMYAGCSEVNFIYQSKDSGATWQGLNGVPLGNSEVEYITGSGDAVFVALSDEGGVVGSIDRGKSWSRYDFGLASLNTRTLNYSNGKLYVGTWGAGVFQMTVPSDLNLPTVDLFPPPAAVSLPTELDLYWPPSEGARTYQVHVSADSLFSDIVSSDSTIIQTSAHVTGLQHYHTYYWNVWAVGDYGPPLLIVSSRFTTGPGIFNLSQNYPNPFNGQTTIGFTVPAAGYVTIEIFNILGQRIVTLVSQYYIAGDYSAVWNASRMSSGVYLCRMRAGKSVTTKKMLLVR
jgi:photosystem II stability/assembly factor-like uncharacterized protein